MPSSEAIVVQLQLSRLDPFDLSKFPFRHLIVPYVYQSAKLCFEKIRQVKVDAVILPLENPETTNLALRLHLGEAGYRPIIGVIADEYPEFIGNWEHSFWIPYPIRVSAAIERIELFIRLSLAEQKIETLKNTLTEQQGLHEEAKKQIFFLNQDIENQVIQRTRDIAAQLQQSQIKSTAQTQLGPQNLLDEPLCQQILDRLPLMICFIDSTYRFVYLNRQMAHFLGRDEDQLLGRKITSLKAPFDSLFNPSKTDEALISPLGIKGEERILVEGKIKTVYLGKQRFEVSGLSAPYLLCYGMDLSLQRNLDEQTSNTQKLEALGTMAGGIAHDFNNLLFAMLLNLSLLKGARNPLKCEHYIAQITQACERAKGMTRQILTFSKQKEHRMEPTDITLVLEEVFSLARSVTSKNIRFEPVYHCHNPNCLADSSQIHQVITNLVNNAAFVLNPQGGQVVVSLVDWEVLAGEKVAQELKPGKYVKIGVKDNGPGIKPHILPKIFDPFFSTKPSDEGTGLGLAVAQGIVHRHQGCITVTSILGRGTLFEVFLPQTEKPLARRDPGALSSECGGRAVSGKQLLLVDDELLVLEALGDFFGDEGFKVVTFNNPREALSYGFVHLDEIDLILCDQNMPEMTGLSFCKQISQKKPELPVILYSGYSTELTLDRALEAGASLLFSKPLEQTELLMAINQLIDR